MMTNNRITKQNICDKFAPQSSSILFSCYFGSSCRMINLRSFPSYPFLKLEGKLSHIM